ncbi:MAG: site-2 protease family protein [Rhodothermales bacterium]|nr:site-2 protease family protein [Rhodothermales bacterium]
MEINTKTPAADPAIAGIAPLQTASRPRYWLHILLFLSTLLTTTTIWGLWSSQPATSMMDMFSWRVLSSGLIFSTSLLTFLTVHEFGHYFAARHHSIDATLPYYIPLPFIGIGTLGAVIRIKSAIPSRTKLFDVGASGPIAGFVAAVLLLFIALATLPPPDNVMQFDGHPELKAFVEQNGTYPTEILPPIEQETSSIVVGQTLLFWMASSLFDNVPPMFEMYHYPLLFAAWLGLFFTALNLLPVGQLDGGHILYALVGPVWHKRIASGFVLLLLASGSIGFVADQTPAMLDMRATVGPFFWFILAAILFFYLNKVFSGAHRFIAPWLLVLMVLSAVAPSLPRLADTVGYSGWLIWCLLIVFLIKIEHPPVYIEDRLTGSRKILAIASFVVFILCFSIRPLAIV